MTLWSDDTAEVNHHLNDYMDELANFNWLGVVDIEKAEKLKDLVKRFDL